MCRTVVLVATLCLLAACALPRGAALEREVLQEQKSGTSDFLVVPVTRASLPQISIWPSTGWKGHYSWLSGGGGPVSPIIRPGDKVNLVIWDSQDNSLLTSSQSPSVNLSGAVVDAGGSIFLPYVGDVRIAGMTPSHARQNIETALNPIVPTAQVQLSLESGLGNSVDLVGGVASPGTYPLATRNTTLLTLLAQGGGISPALKNPLVRLVRGGQTYEIRAESLFRDASRNIALRGEDKVVVEEDDRYFTAIGATGKEELVPFEREHLSALDALSIVGGLSDARANLKGVLVLREYPVSALRADGSGPTKSQVIFTFDLTSASGLFAARKFEINPKDTLLATESAITSVQTVFGLIGRVIGLNNQVASLGN